MIIKPLVRPVLLAVILLTAGGCASIDARAERESVLADAAGRAGLVPDDVEHQAGDILGMPGAVRYGLVHSPRLQATLAELGLARARAVENSRPLNPVLELVWFPHDGEADFLEVEVSAALVNAISTPWRARSAAQRYDAARADALLSTLTYAASVQEAWVRAVAARQRLELEESLALASAASLLVAEELAAAGNIPPLDLERERVFARQAELRQMRARLAVQQAVRVLAQRINMPALQASELPSRLEHPAREFMWPDEADLRARNLVLARTRSDAAAAGREAAIENLDSVLDHAELGRVAEREDGEWERGWALETALPVFDFGLSRRAAARIRADQALDRHRDATARFRLTRDYVDAGRTAAVAEADLLRDAQLPGVARLMERSQRQYNAMQIGVFELLAAFEITAQTGQAYVDALERAWIADIRARQLLAGDLPELPGDAPGRRAEPVMDTGGH